MPDRADNALSNITSDNYFLADATLGSKASTDFNYNCGWPQKEVTNGIGPVATTHRPQTMPTWHNCIQANPLMYSPPRMDSVHRDRSGLTQDFATQRENVCICIRHCHFRLPSFVCEYQGPQYVMNLIKLSGTLPYGGK